MILTFGKNIYLMTKLTWQQQEGDGGVVGVLLLVLGPGIVEDGKEGEVTSVAPVATDDEQGANDVEEARCGGGTACSWRPGGGES